MSWWERQYQKYLVNGTAGVKDDPLSNEIRADSVLTVEALGPVVVTYAEEPVASGGDIVYVLTR